MDKIYDKVAIVSYIEEEMLKRTDVSYHFVRQVKHRATHGDNLYYNLMVQYMKAITPLEQKKILKRMNASLRIMSDSHTGKYDS